MNNLTMLLSPRRRWRRRRRVPNDHLSSFVPFCYLREKVIPTCGFMFFFVRSSHLFLLLTILQQQQSTSALLAELPTEPSSSLSSLSSSSLSTATKTDYRDQLPRHISQSHSPDVLSPSFDVKSSPMSTRNSKKLSSFDHTPIEIFKVLTLRTHSLTEDSSQILSTTQTQNSIGLHPRISNANCFGTHCGLDTSSSYLSLGTAVPIHMRPSSSQLTPASSSREIISGFPFQGPTSVVKSISAGPVLMARTNVAITAAPQPRHKKKRHKKRKKKRRKKKKRKKKKHRRKGRRTTVEWEVEELRKTTPSAKTQKNARIKWVTKHDRNLNVQIPSPVTISDSVRLKSEKVLAPYQRHESSSLFSSRMTSQPISPSGVKEKTFQTIKSTPVFKASSISLKETVTFPNLIHSRPLGDSRVSVNHLRTDFTQSNFAQPRVSTKTKNYFNELNEIHSSLTKNQIPILNSNLKEFINIHSSVTTPYFIPKSSKSKPLSKDSKTFPLSFKFNSIYKPGYDELQSSAQLLLNSHSSLKNFQSEDSIFHSVHASRFSDMEPPKSQSLSQTKFSVHPTLSEQSSFLTTSETVYMSLTNVENSSKFISLENMSEKFSEITGKPFDAIKPTKYSFSAKETMTFTDLIPNTLQNHLIPSRHSRTSLVPSAQTNYDNELNKVNPSLTNNKISAQITHSNTQKPVNIRKHSTTPSATSSSETNVFKDSNILSSSFSFHSTYETGFSRLKSPQLLRNTQLENSFSSLELPHKTGMSKLVNPTMSSNIKSPESLIASQIKISMHTNISEQTSVQTSTLNKTAHIVSKNTVNSTNNTSPRSILAFHTIFPLIIGKKLEITKKPFQAIKASSVFRASFPIKETLMVFNLVPSRSLHNHLVTSNQLIANLVPSARTNYDNKLKEVNLSLSKSQILTQISPSNTQIPLNTHSYSTTPYYFNELKEVNLSLSKSQIPTQISPSNTQMPLNTHSYSTRHYYSTNSSESKFVSKDLNPLSPSSNFNSIMTDFSKLKSPLSPLGSQHENTFSSLQDFPPVRSSSNSIQPTKSSDMESLSQTKISTLANISEQNPLQSSTSNETAHVISKNAVNSKKYTSLKSILAFQARQIPVIKKSSEVIQNSLKTGKVTPVIRTSLISVRETMTFLNFAGSKSLPDHLLTSYLKSSTLTPSVQTNYDNEHNRVHRPLNKNQIPSADSNPPKFIDGHNSVTIPYIMTESSESEPLSKELNILSSSFNFHDEVQSSQLLISTRLENAFPSLQDIPHKVSILKSIYPTISSNMESTQSQSLSQIKSLIHPTPSEQKSIFTLTNNKTLYTSSISAMNYTKSLRNVPAFRRNPPIIENSFEISKPFLPTSSSAVDNPGLPQNYISHSHLKAEQSQDLFSTVSDQLISKTPSVSSTLTPLSVSDVSENLNMMDVLTFIDTMLQLKAEDSAIAELPSSRSSSIALQSLYSPASSLVSDSQTNAQHERTKKSADEEKPLSLRKIPLKDIHFEHSREIVLESSSVDEPVYQSFSTEDFILSSMATSKTPPTKELKEYKSSTFADSLNSGITSSQEHFTDVVLSSTIQPQSTTSLNDVHPFQTPSSPPATFDINPTPTPLPVGFSLNHTVDQWISQMFSVVEDKQSSSFVLSLQKKQSQKDSSDISPSTTEVTFSRTTNDLTSSDSMILFLEQERKRISNFMPSNSKENIFSEGLSPLSAEIMSDQQTSDNPIAISSSFPEISSFDSTSRTSVLPIAPNMASFAIPLDYPKLSATSFANKLHFPASESHSKSLNTILIPEGGSNMTSSTVDTTDELFSAPNLFSDSADVKPDSWDASTDSTSANSEEAFVTESDIQSTTLITRDVSITAEQITSSKYEDGDSLLNSKLLISPVQLLEYQELSRKKAIVDSSFASADLNSQDELAGSKWKTFDLNTLEDDLFLTSHLKFSLVSPFEAVAVDSSTVQLTPRMSSSSSVLESSSTSSIWTLSSPPFLKEPGDNIKTTEDDLALSGSVNKASSNPFDYASSMDLASENRDFSLPEQFLKPSYSSVGISSSIFQPLSGLISEGLSTSQAEKPLLFMSEQSLLLHESSSSYSSLKSSKVSSSPSSSSQLTMLLPVSYEESSHIESSRLATRLSTLLSSPLDLSEQISPSSAWLDELSISLHLFSLWSEDSRLPSSVMAEPSMSVLSGFTHQVDQPEWASQVEESSQLSKSFYQVQSIYLADSNVMGRQLDLPFVSQLSPLVDTLQKKSSQLSLALSVPVITQKLSSQIMSTQSSYITSQMTSNLLSSLETTSQTMANFSSPSSQTTSQLLTDFTSPSSQTISQMMANFSSSLSQTTSQMMTNFSSPSLQTTSQILTNFSSPSSQTTSQMMTNFSSPSSQTTSQMMTNFSSPSLKTTSQLLTNFSSPSSQTTSQMMTNFSSPSSQSTYQMTTNFSSPSSQSTYQMTTNFFSTSSQTTSQMMTNFPSPSSQTISQMMTNTLSSSSLSQLTSQLSSQFTLYTSVMHTPSTSAKFASQITTNFTSLPSSQITSKVARLITPSSLAELITSKISTKLNPSPSTNITSHIFAIHISSPSSQITSPMLTLFTPTSPSQISSDMSTLLRPSKSSQISSDMPTLFRPSQSSQISSDMPTLLRPSKSSLISSDMPTLLRPSQSSQISSDMPTLLRPSQSSQFPSDMPTLLRPSQSSQIESHMSTLLRPSPFSQIESHMSTLLRPSPSSQISSDMSTLLRPSPFSQISSDMSTLLRHSPSSQISSDMSTLLRPSPFSQISSMSTLLRPSPFSQISSDMRTLLRPSQSSQISYDMSTLLRPSQSLQISSDMSTLLRPSPSSQFPSDMSTLLRPSQSLEITSDISTLFRLSPSSPISFHMSTLLEPSSSSQISSDRSTLLRSSQSSQIIYDMSTLLRPSQSSPISSDMSTLLRPSPSSQISSDMSTLLRPSPFSQMSSDMSTLLRPSQSSQISSDMPTLLRPSQSSQFSSDMSTLLRPSRSSEITSDMSTLFKPSPSSQITFHMSTLLEPSSSSQISSDRSTLLRSSPSSQITSYMSTLLRPSPSSQISSNTSTLLRPFQSSQITPYMSTVLRPSPSLQISSDMSTLFTPTSSSNNASDISTLLILSSPSQLTSHISRLITPNSFSNIESDMSTLLIPSPSSKITSHMLTFVTSSPSSQITSNMSTLITPNSFSNIESNMSTLLVPSPSSKITSHMYTFVTSSLSSQITSHMSTLFIPSSSSKITSHVTMQHIFSSSSEGAFQMSSQLSPKFITEISQSSEFMSLFVANKSIKSETLQFTSPQLSSQTKFTHQTLLFSSSTFRQSVTFESKFNSMQSISNSSQIHSLFTPSQNSDLSHQTSQFSSGQDSSHPSSSSIQLKSSRSKPLLSSELEVTNSTKFSSSYPTSDLTSQPMLSSSPKTQLFSSFSSTLHSIPEKLNSSSFQSESFKTEIISMSNFDSNLMRTFSVSKTLSRLFNSTSLFHSTTKLATFSDIDKSSHPTTPLDITLPTTSEPLLNLSQAFQNYWVITVIKVRLSINVSTAAFRKEMERNLAQAYVEAYHRGEHILNGTYQPLRKKRFALVDDVALQMINITRSPSNSSNNVSMVYYMEKRGKPVPAISAAKHLSLLQPQELAIYLKQVVVLSAITYLKPPHPEPSKDWIIGAVLGTLASALFLIWCILFIYFKCFRMRPTKSVHSKSPTPQLVQTTSMQDVNTDTSETNLIRQDIPMRKQPSLLKKNGSKKQAYSVALPKVGKKNKKESESEVSLKNLYEEKKKMKKAVNGRIIKKSEVKTDVKIKMDAVNQKQNGCLVVGEHNGYSKEPDNYSDYEIESGNRVEMLPPLSINCGTSNERLSPFHYVNLPMIQPHFSLTASRQEADDELRHQADHLRRIKKQRLKEERRKLRHVELYQNSPHYFLNHGQDIEMVENRQKTETADESQFEELRRGSRRRRYKRREKHDLSSQEDSSLNDVYGGDETWAPQPETLQRTREKMHKLLDDAFQLIAKHERKKVSASIHPLSNGCTRKSSIGKRRTRRQRPCVLETPPDSCHRKSSPSDSTPDEKLERLHTPLFFHNHYSPHNRHRVSPAIPPPWNAAGDEAAKIAAEHQAWSSPYVSPRLNRSDPTDERRIPTISYPTDHNQMEFGYQPSFSFTRPTLSTQFSPYTSSRQMFHNRHSGYHSVDNSEDVPINLFQSATHCFAPQIENNIELNTFEPPSFAKHLSRSPGSSKTSPIDDEIHVIHNNNVRPDPSSQPLIQSIRDELMRLSNEKEEKNSLRSRIVLDRNI